MKPLYRTLGTLFCVGFLALSGCVKDLGEYDYRSANEVSYLDVNAETYSFIAGKTVTITPPISLSNPDVDTAAVFKFEWFLNDKLESSDPIFIHTFEKPGIYNLILRITDRKGGEVYLSDPGKYQIKISSNIGWGWMILSSKENKSSLSFIDPDLVASYDVYESMNAEGPLGTDPKNIAYYWVQGTIPGLYVGGLAKILINQGSGSVTLNADNLQKDMFLKDEFSNGAEPTDLNVSALAWKEWYYAIHDASTGSVYLRRVGMDHAETPYYGRYNALPMEFDGGSHISVMGTFSNMNSNECAAAVSTILYDDRNGRFIGLYRSVYGQGENYTPAVTYFNYYDSELTVPANVLRVNNMGAGTKVLALGTWDGMDLIPSGGYNIVELWSKYYTVIKTGGSYYLHDWTLKEYSNTNHVITDTHQILFPGAAEMTDRSIVRMAGNFKIHPYFYFTDGDRKLFAYNVNSNSYRLAYTAPARITGIYPNPVICVFSKYGGNPETPNFRVALSLENGDISVGDVSNANLVKLFEGFTSNIEIKHLKNFGDIKGMVWCNRGYDGEF